MYDQTNNLDIYFTSAAYYHAKVNLSHYIHLTRNMSFIYGFSDVLIYFIQNISFYPSKAIQIL